MRQKQKVAGAVAASQLRSGTVHPFTDLRGFVPLGTGEERIYRQLREAIPVLDAAVGKLVRLSGGFEVECKNPRSQQALENFLRSVPCGRGQVGIDSFLGGYVDSLLTVGRSVGEIVVSGGKIGVTEADCPDHYCMHRGMCNSGAQIVCLPNRLVIKFIESDSVDGVVG